MKHANIEIHVLKFVSGRLVIQAIGLVTIPILTRLYLPEHFGALQIIDAFLYILFEIVCGKFEMAIPLAKDDQEKADTIALSVLVSLFVTAALTAGVLFAAPAVAEWYGMPALRHYLWCLPALTLLGGVKNALSYWAARDERFTAMAASDVAYSLGERFGSLAWGFAVAPSSLGLFVARFIGVFLRIAALIHASRAEMRRLFRGVAISPASLRATAIRHKKFPLLQIWAVLLNTISSQLPSLLLGKYFSVRVVGYYGMSERMLGIPISLLRDAIATVTFSTMAKEYQRTGSLTDITKNIFLRMTQISFFPLLIFTVFGKELLQAVLGAEWTEAGVYCRILSVWQAFGFLNMPLKVSLIMNRQEVGVFMNILTLAVRIVGILCGVALNSPRVSLIAFVAFSVVTLIINCFWQLRLARVSLRWASRLMGEYIGLSLLLLAPTRWLIGEQTNIAALFGVLSLLSLGYLGVVAWLDASFAQYAQAIFSRIRGKASCKS